MHLPGYRQGDAYHGHIEVLLVCTGNICRSPMAEALLRQRADEAGVDVGVASAGLLLREEPASVHAIAVMRDRGLDVTPHRSRVVDPSIVEDADLILGLARQHVREVVVARPEAWPKTFTLKELVRRGEAIGARRPDEALTEWLARAHEGRATAGFVGDSSDDDVADPIGRAVGYFEETAAELDDLVGRLFDLAWSAERRATTKEPVER